MADDSKTQLTCSFCGKPRDDVTKLIAGPNVNICDECVVLCNDIIQIDSDKKQFTVDAALTDSDLPVPQKSLMTPRKILENLDDYVIGQKHAKKILSVAVYNHYKRIENEPTVEEQADGAVELDKSNVLLIGPTGCGKTLLAKTLARLIEVPFAIVDATTLTEAGYVGDDVETIINKLIQAADYDIEQAERGIIYVDEIDKISRKSEGASITRDVSGEGVQQALLKLIEGTEASVPPQGGRKHPQQELIKIKTDNILFICSGAFAGLETIVQDRSEKTSIGFSASVTAKSDEKGISEILSDLEPEDLIKYGLIPEFIGRLPVEAVLEELDEAALIRILTEPKNALIKQFVKIFDLEGVLLEFTDTALIFIAQKAIKRKTGARGLRSVIEHSLLDIMFDLPDLKNKDKLDKIVIDVDSVANDLNPTFVFQNQVSA